MAAEVFQGALKLAPFLVPFFLGLVTMRADSVILLVRDFPSRLAAVGLSFYVWLVTSAARSKASVLGFKDIDFAEEIGAGVVFIVASIALFRWTWRTNPEGLALEWPTWACFWSWLACLLLGACFPIIALLKL